MNAKSLRANLLNVLVTSLLIGSSAVPYSPVAAKQVSNSTSPQTSNTNTKFLKAQNIKPGRYCYKLKTKTLSAEAQLLVKPNNSVTGGTQATIEDRQNSYFTSYTQTFEGNLRNSQLKVNVTTEIENDIQEAQETWKLTENSLSTTRETYKKVDCSQLQSKEFPRLIRLKFARGSNSAVVENSVIRGSRDIYILGAKAGQTMKVSITSLENNAVFNVVAPNQEVLQQEATRKVLKLPTTGNYEIVVGGTRGNATYKLRVEIN